MEYEENLRNIYQGTYEILEKMNDPERTSDAQSLLRHFFDNRLRIVQGEERIPEGNKYNSIVRKINNEYEEKFDLLKEKQGKKLK